MPAVAPQRQAPQQPPPTQPAQPANTHAILAALVVVLLSGLTFEATVAYVTTLLGSLGIPPEAVRRALSLIRPSFGADGFEALVAEAGPAEGEIRRTEAARAASYIVNASLRLAANPDPSADAAERRFVAQHVGARQRRLEAAAQVDSQVRLYGPLVGWYSVRDAVTTPECREAHGHNFDVATPPAVGYPGTLHGGTCRCRAGPPHRGAELLA